MMKKLKENQNKQFTTDVNGNILLVKSAGVDKLQSEFFFPKLNILEKPTISAPNANSNNNGKYEKKDTLASRIPSSTSKIYQKLPTAKGFGFIENANLNSNNVTNFLLNTNNNNNNTVVNSYGNNAKNAEADKDRMVSILPAGSSYE